MTLKAYGTDYHLHRMLAVDDNTVTFAYYDDKKTLEMPEMKVPQTRAYPALTLPYEAIECVEFNPGKPDTEKTVGFQMS